MECHMCYLRSSYRLNVTFYYFEDLLLHSIMEVLHSIIEVLEPHPF